MGRRKQDTNKSKVVKMLIDEYDIKTTEDIENALKDLLGETMENLLKAELDEHLDYEYATTPLDINTRNGYSKKTLKSSKGPIEIEVPRDRAGTFNPKVLRKYQKDISNIENQIISMYAKGMTTRDISSHIKDIYGFELSASMVTKITNKILPSIDEWQNRPLEKVYPFMFLDAIHYHVRENGTIIKKAVYIAMAYNMDGFKEILGMWIGENESSKYWLMVLNELKDRGVEEVLLVSTDNLTGFSEALEAAFPKIEIQKCIIHQIRNSTRYVSYKDRRPLMEDLKKVYQANNEKIALKAFEDFKAKWNSKYPSCVRSWEKNWVELMTFFKYPSGIRRLIYTTNVIEAFNRQLRKVTKSKTIFPNDFALSKSLYLAMGDASIKWSKRIEDWDMILAQIKIFFKDRLEAIGYEI